jgi:hypothetical protein
MKRIKVLDQRIADAQIEKIYFSRFAQFIAQVAAEWRQAKNHENFSSKSI